VAGDVESDARCERVELPAGHDGCVSADRRDHDHDGDGRGDDEKDEETAHG